MSIFLIVESIGSGSEKFVDDTTTFLVDTVDDASLDDVGSVLMLSEREDSSVYDRDEARAIRSLPFGNDPSKNVLYRR